MSTQQPSIGRIVHVVRPTPGLRDGGAVCLPAIIDALYEPDILSLTVFSRGSTRGMVARYDETASTVNSWHWPERVGG